MNGPERACARRSLGDVLTGILTVLLILSPGSAGAQEATVTITGGGYGHGIGMSQYGAYGRALNGKNAKQIVERYYTGAKLQSQTIKGDVRVGLLSGRNAISFTSEASGADTGKVTLTIQGDAEPLASGQPGDTFKLEPSSTGGFRVFKNGKRLERDGTSVFGSPDVGLIVRYQEFGSFFAPEGKTHRYAYGTAEIASYASNSCSEDYCARLVLKLSMQKYLYGLGEVPSSWPAAVLQAQAIAGRTYALNKKNAAVRYPCGCHVVDSTLDQAYIGDSKRTGSGQWWPDWKGAVDNTKDQVITYDGTVLQYALYSASSGGYTESNAAVWGSSPVEYLKPVKDGADRAQGKNPHFEWDPITMTWDEFSDKLNASFGTGNLKDFDLVKPFGRSGRVTVVNDDGTGGVRIKGRKNGVKKIVRVSGWDIRSALGLKDTLFRVKSHVAVGAAFQSKYDELNGAPGTPRSRVYPVPKNAAPAKRLGKAQDFSTGRMTLTTSSDRVVWQFGPVLGAYDSLGRERSKLGMPVTGIWGKTDYKGASYTSGVLIYTAEREGIPILGTFAEGFQRTGGVSGELGLPLKAREQRPTLPDGGRRQRFEHGTLYRGGSGTEAYAVLGKIDRRYRRMGEASSDCGYPVADMALADGVWRAVFEGGTIVLRPSGKVVVNCTA